MSKSDIIKLFQLNPDRYWKVKIFDDMGFIRQRCKNCGKFFWSVKNEEKCNDSTCKPYEFISNPPTRRQLDYIETLKVIQEFFVSTRHQPIERYPVVCRWFPGLFFNIASIVSFQRAIKKQGRMETIFEFPANPLFIAQPCLRFNDIPNVGVTGRHLTNFIMLGQHSLYPGGYWKDEAVELNFRLLTDIFGINKEDIHFIEDVWVGPAAFGPCIEYHVKGLELGNMVFTEFQGTLDRFSEMKQKVIDVGIGLERYTWISNGTPTLYDIIFGDIIQKMKKMSGIDGDRNLLLEYSKVAGALNLEDVPDIDKVMEHIAHLLDTDINVLKESIMPMQQIYAAADHTKTLLFAVADGGIPSNVGGGYNLRVVLRRALDFCERLGIDMLWLFEQHAKYLKPVYPELIDYIPQIQKILHVEKVKWKENRAKAEKIIAGIKNEVDEQKLLELYDSHGITPDFIASKMKERGINVKIPHDFYMQLTERHQSERLEEEGQKIDVNGLPETETLFYEKPLEFRANIIKIINDKFVVLDRTAFYAEAGGQLGDTGYIGNLRVFDVKNIDGVIVHATENASQLKEGQIVECKVDGDRRRQLSIHHTATHIINAAARELLGNHVWQGGTKKDVDKAHLDITHYEMFTEEDVEKIEKKAREIIKAAINVKKEVMPRLEAERRYGFRIYQGGAVPLDMLRIVSIGDIDHQACGGTHLDNTSEVGNIIITKTERPQDGIVRLFFVAGPAAERYLEAASNRIDEICKIIGVKRDMLKKGVMQLLATWKEKKKNVEMLRKLIAAKMEETLKFEERGGLKILVAYCGEKGIEELKEISRRLSGENTVIFLLGKTEGINIFASAGKSTGVDISYILKAVCEKFGGKGGGHAMLAQGKIREGDAENIIKFVRGILYEK